MRIAITDSAGWNARSPSGCSTKVRGERVEPDPGPGWCAPGTRSWGDGVSR
jgi:hypothetical protein